MIPYLFYKSDNPDYLKYKLYSDSEGWALYCSSLLSILIGKVIIIHYNIELKDPLRLIIDIGYIIMDGVMTNVLII